MFSCEFCKISKNTFSYRTPPVAASEHWNFERMISTHNFQIWINAYCVYELPLSTPIHYPNLTEFWRSRMPISQKLAHLQVLLISPLKANDEIARQNKEQSSRVKFELSKLSCVRQVLKLNYIHDCSSSWKNKTSCPNPFLFFITPMQFLRFPKFSHQGLYSWSAVVSKSLEKNYFRFQFFGVSLESFFLGEMDPNLVSSSDVVWILRNNISWSLFFQYNVN